MNRHSISFVVLAAMLFGGWSCPDVARAAEITIDASNEHQTIEGFGTCLVSWGDFPRKTYTPKFVKFYRRTMGLNIMRESLNGFQVPETEDPADITWRDVKPTDRAQVFVDFAKRLKRIDPEARLVGTVWTPPVWMKMNRQEGNGTRFSGRKNRAIRADGYRGDTNRVDPAKFKHFVHWLVAVAEWHKRQGIPLYAISPANEPRFSQWYGSCVWTAKDLATIIAMLGEELEKAGLGDVLIFGPEDMTGHLHGGGTKGMVDAIAANPRALKHLDRFASHGYTDGVAADTSKDSSRNFWQLIKRYNKPCWMTESGTKGHKWPEPIVDGVARAIHNAFVGGNASAFLPWQVAGTKPDTHSLAIGDQPTKKSYAMMHYSRCIPPGAVRVDAKSDDKAVQVSAYVHPERAGLTVVLLNPSDEEESVNVRLGKAPATGAFRVYRTSDTDDFASAPDAKVTAGVVRVTLPARSIVSLVSQGKAIGR